MFFLISSSFSMESSIEDYSDPLLPGHPLLTASEITG
jgi:hypothetical protein